MARVLVIDDDAGPRPSRVRGGGELGLSLAERKGEGALADSRPKSRLELKDPERAPHSSRERRTYT